MIKHSVNVVFNSEHRRDQRHPKSTLTQALEDAADLRIAIAGGQSKRTVKTKGRWRLAPYWKGAVVTVEAQEVSKWKVVEETRTIALKTINEEVENVQVRFAV
jgi:hypothetical protein